MTTVMGAECRNGHALTDPTNVYITPDGYRRCRTCRRISEARTRKPRTAATRVPNRKPVSPRKYRGWAMTVWAEMNEWDRMLLRFGLGEFPG